MPRTSPLRLQVLFSLVATVLGLLVIEGLVSVILAATAALGVAGISEESHCEYDSTLGWTNQRGIHIPDLYGPGVSYTTNEQGFRSNDGDYSPRVPPGRFRVIALGDSFTMGYGVGDDETYPAQMEALCPQLEVVNMGLGGYGIGQDYLWYMRDGVELEADLLVFAFIAADFHRMMYDRFLGYGKPVLRLEDGALTTRNVPVPNAWGRRKLWVLREFVRELSLGRTVTLALGRRGGAVRQPGDDTEGFAPVAGRVFEELQRTSAERGQGFATVYLPVVRSLPQEPTPQARWIEDFAARKGIAFFNLTPDFSSLSLSEVDRLQIGEGNVPGVTANRERKVPNPHYSPAGNRFVAERLLAHLRVDFPALPCGERSPDEGSSGTRQ